MKMGIVGVLVVIVVSSAGVFAEDAPRFYSDDDLKGYGSSSGNSSERYYQDRREERDEYYRDRREERNQYYEDRKTTMEEHKRNREEMQAQERRDKEDRDKRREECRREANSKLFWCPQKDYTCKKQWTNAYRDCNYLQ